MIQRGYQYVLAKGHPFATSRGYVLEHRLVMEKSLGRLLNPDEVVHHINGDRTDNRLENLQLFKSKAAHRNHHADSTEYYLDQYADYIVMRYAAGVGASIIAHEINSHKSCVLKWMKKKGIKRRNPKKRVFCKDGYKWCNVCKKELPETDFYVSMNTYDGLRNRCIDCAKMEAKNFVRRGK